MNLLQYNISTYTKVFFPEIKEEEKSRFEPASLKLDSAARTTTVNEIRSTFQLQPPADAAFVSRRSTNLADILQMTTVADCRSSEPFPLMSLQCTARPQTAANHGTTSFVTYW